VKVARSSATRVGGEIGNYRVRGISVPGASGNNKNEPVGFKRERRIGLSKRAFAFGRSARSGRKARQKRL